MIIRFIATEIDLKTSPGELRPAIEATLQKWGEPLRWAVVNVDEHQRTVRIEAVVTVAE